MKGSLALFVHFVEVMTGDCFKKKFTVFALEVRHFLERLIKVDALAARTIYMILKKKADTRSRPLEKVMLSRSTCSILKGIGTKQVLQILRASSSVEPCEHKEHLLRQMLFRCFHEGHWPGG